MEQQLKKPSNLFEKISKFAIIGFINTGIDFVIFNFVCHFLATSIFNIPPAYIAQLCSATVLLPISFLLNRKFTFKSNVRKRDAFLPFFATNMFSGYCVQNVVIFIVRSILGYAVPVEWILNNIAKCCGVACSMIVNFVSYSFIFKVKNHEPEESVLDTIEDK